MRFLSDKQTGRKIPVAGRGALADTNHAAQSACNVRSLPQVLDRLLPAVRSIGASFGLDLMELLQLFVAPIGELPASRQPDILASLQRGLSPRALPALQLALLARCCREDVAESEGIELEDEARLAHSIAHGNGAHAQVSSLVKLCSAVQRLGPALDTCDVTVYLRSPTVEDDGCGPSGDAESFLTMRLASLTKQLDMSGRKALMLRTLSFVRDHLVSRPLQHRLLSLDAREARRLQGDFLHLSTLLLAITEIAEGRGARLRRHAADLSAILSPSATAKSRRAATARRRAMRRRALQHTRRPSCPSLTT